MSTLSCESAAVAALIANPRNARTHSNKQIAQIAASIDRFGFTNPVLVDDAMMILAGHGRVAAAKQLGLKHVPVIRLSHMSEADKRAYVLADNKLALNAGWDDGLLAIELAGLIELGFDVELTGFEPAEIDLVIETAGAENKDQSGPQDDVPALASASITEPGDIWRLGPHRLICGDARLPEIYLPLMEEETAAVMFTDPPYNVKIGGHVRTTDAHREFAMASGEMDKEAFTAFLEQSLGAGALHCRDGAIAFVCMDWRHVEEVNAAGMQVFSELKNLCVWVKSNGGMGSLYRSQHELVFVFKKGAGAHINNVELGRFGRNRTNVWSYAGANSFGRERQEALDLHPTVKPVALVEDALKDVSKRNDIVLDPFGGSGSTLIAAHRCGRRAHLVELDPAYCDVIVKRYQAYTGLPAKHHQSGRDFDALASDLENASEVP